uniref:phage tail protein n=1 Tax=Haliangium sp. TaxID=2663208 RepID=UPI003D134FD7
MSRVVGAQAIAARRVRVSFDVAMADADALLRPEQYRFEALTAPAVSVAAQAVEAAGPLAVEVLLDIELSQRALYRVEVSDPAESLGQATFAGFVPPSWPRERQFDLYRHLPELNRQLDVTGDLQRFMGVLQDTLDLLLAEIDRFADILDPDLAPEPFLDSMLADLGNPFAFDLSPLQKRRLLSVLVQIYRQKGTAAGIRNAIRFFLGVDVTAVTSFHGETLTLGESRLGEDWVLGPSEPFARYAFDLTVSRRCTDTERRQIRRIVDFMRPAHT